MSTLNLEITADADDGYEKTSPASWNSDNAQHFVTAGYNTTGPYACHIGLRFLNVTVAQGATINDGTHLHGYTNVNETDLNSDIYAEDTDDAAALDSTRKPSALTKTTATVAWDATLTKNNWTQSPEIKTIIQEVVDRAGWASGNDLVICIMNGQTAATKFGDFANHENGSNPVKLDIEYTAAAAGAETLVGAVSAAASLTAGVKVAKRLAGATTAAASTAGGMKLAKKLGGAVTAAASVQGSLKVEHELVGAVAATASVAAGLTSFKNAPLPGAVAASAAVEGSLKVAHSLGIWPKIRSSATSKNTSEVKNHTVTLPSAVFAGDLLVVVYGENGSDAVTFPGGWAKTLDSAGDLHLTIGTKTADGTEGGTNITVTSADAHRSQHIAYAVQHASGTLVSAVASGENANPNPPSVTASTPTNTLVVAAEIHATPSAATGYPSGYTQGQNTVTGSSTAVAAAAKHVTAGSENPGTFTIPASAAWKAGSLLIPAAVPVAAAAAVEGSLKVAHELDGAVTAAASVAGGLKVAHELDGTVRAGTEVGSVAQPVKVGHRLAGAVAAAATVEGGLLGATRLAGAVSAAASVQGSLKVEHELDGAVVASATVAGAILRGKLLSGTIAAASQVEGTLAVAKSLVGAVGSSTTVAGGLKASHSLIGAVGASAAISGDVDTGNQLAGAVAATSSVAGGLAVKHQLAGTVAAAASLSGVVEVEHELPGVIIIPDSAVQGDLKVAKRAVGAVVASVSVVGALAVVKQLQGAVAATTVTAGFLRPGKNLIGAIGANAVLTGGLLRLGKQITGTIGPAASITARLMVIGQIGHAAVAHTLATVATLTDSVAAAATATDSLAAVATLTETGDP